MTGAISQGGAVTDVPACFLVPPNVPFTYTNTKDPNTANSIAVYAEYIFTHEMPLQRTRRGRVVTYPTGLYVNQGVFTNVNASTKTVKNNSQSLQLVYATFTLTPTVGAAAQCSARLKTTIPGDALNIVSQGIVAANGPVMTMSCMVPLTPGCVADFGGGGSDAHQTVNSLVTFQLGGDYSGGT